MSPSPLNSRSSRGTAPVQAVLLAGVICLVLAPGCEAPSAEGEGEGVGREGEGEGEAGPGRPVLSALVVGDITATSARVSFTTDVPATTALKLGLSEEALEGANLQPVSEVLATEHETTLSLSGNTAYFAVAVAFNDDGLSTESEVVRFTTPAENAAPVVSDLVVSEVAEDRATVSWTTDEPATTQVSVTDFDLIDAAVPDPPGPPTTTHRVVLEGLSCNTTYTFDAVSADAEGLETRTDVATFTTTRCALFVDASAAAAGDGTRDAPFRRLQDAINAVRVTDAILVAAGAYNEDVTIDGDTDGDGAISLNDISYAGLEVRGGYNADFTAVEGRSVVQGQGTQQEPGVTTALRIFNSADILLSDFEIRGYDGLGDAPDVARVRVVDVTSADPIIDRVVIIGGVAVADDVAVSVGINANGQSAFLLTNSLVTSGRAGRQGALGNLVAATNVAGTFGILDINASIVLANNTIILQDASSLLRTSIARGLSFGDPAEGAGEVLVTNCIFATDNVTASNVDLIGYRTPGFTVVELSNNLFVSDGTILLDFESQASLTNKDGNSSFTEADALEDSTRFLVVENNLAAQQSDDVFTDAAAGNFSLRSGSIAIDAGKDNSATLYGSFADVDGQPRQRAVDIGAYESR